MASGHTIVRTNVDQVTLIADFEKLKLRLLGFSRNRDVVQIDARINGTDRDEHEAIAYLSPQEVMTLSKALREFAIAALEKIS